MDMLNKAVIIAVNAHKNQCDKCGCDYICHPVYVALNMDTEEEKITALLHDVVEDTSITLNDLTQYGFKKEILDAVELLTRKPNVEYMDYIKHLKNNPIARKVKLADLKHNSDKERLSGIGKSSEALAEKYERARKYLSE